MIVKQGLHCYFSQSPCESFPCKHGGACCPLYDKNDYICDCRGGRTGKNCDQGEVYIRGYQPKSYVLEAHVPQNLNLYLIFWRLDNINSFPNIKSDEIRRRRGHKKSRTVYHRTTKA